MTSRGSALSLFRQTLDRAAAVVYFLGAVVPLGALAWFWFKATRGAAAELRADGVIALLGLIGALTLVSFVALRRLTRDAMRRVAEENRSQAEMLAASRAIVSTADVDAVHRIAAEAAVAVAAAREGFFFRRGRGAGAELELRSRARDGELPPPELERLAATAAECLRTLRPEVRATAAGRGRLVAVPCVSNEAAGAALAVWIDRDAEPEGSLLDTLATLGSLTASAMGNAELSAANRNFFTHVTNLLVATLDRYLDDRSEHSRRVAGLANQIAHEMTLTERQRERLHFAALLHDIGMLQISRADANDRIKARRHVEAGDAMLRPIKFWEEIAPLVRHHHEHWDGAGYPDGLSGDGIPLESRIIAVAEAFDAMTAEKSYKPAIPSGEAIQRIREAAGSQFDPEVVEAFVSLRH